MKVCQNLIICFINIVATVHSQVAPSGCRFDLGLSSAVCDFATWNPPLFDSQFSPGNVYDVTVKNIKGIMPGEALGGLAGPTGKVNGQRMAIKFQCNLENIILETNTFSSNLKWVETLTIENCYIQDGISDNILANLSGLETLTINSGIVGPLTDSSFAGLSKLQTITINSDFLDKVLPLGLFHGLKSVEKIDLKASSISALTTGCFQGLTKLRTLDLSGNALRTLPSGLFMSMSQLRTVTMTSNPWDCTCLLSWLSTWALYSGVSVDVTCATPSSLAGQTLNRAVVSLGCSSIYSGEDNSKTAPTQDEVTTRQLAYLALGMSGLAVVIAGILACVLCYCRTNVKSSYPVTRRGERQHKPKQHKTARVWTVSRKDNRPPSYKSADRLFVPSPVAGRHSRNDPYFQVKYGAEDL